MRWLQFLPHRRGQDRARRGGAPATEAAQVGTSRLAPKPTNAALLLGTSPMACRTPSRWMISRTSCFRMILCICSACALCDPPESPGLRPCRAPEARPCKPQRYVQGQYESCRGAYEGAYSGPTRGLHWTFPESVRGQCRAYTWKGTRTVHGPGRVWKSNWTGNLYRACIWPVLGLYRVCTGPMEGP